MKTPNAVVMRAAFLTMSAMLLGGTTLADPPQSSWPIEDAMKVLSLSNRTPIALSPDGISVAYTVEDDSV